MNRTAHRLILCFCVSLSGMAPADLFADVPRLPFSGVYGATAGAGSLTGWDRHGGNNPAVIAGPGWSASVTGYTPFGLDGLRVMELEAARDARRWGASLGVRALFDEGGPGESRWSAQGAWKPHEGVSMGGVMRVHPADGNPGIGAGVGVLWRPYRVLSLGAVCESVPNPVNAGSQEARFGVGSDFGIRLGPRPDKRSPPASITRASVEYFVTPGEASTEWRFGLGLQFHPLLSVYAGFSPRQQTAALGMRFGMGDWEGFSALRRHPALGGTSIQGLRWHSSAEGRNSVKGEKHTKQAN